jgi:ABC-type multidrug transport system ATPase subunit
MGTGRTELAMSIFGRSYGKGHQGTVKMHGKPVDVSTVTKAIDAGISYVTEDRKALGLILEEPILKNISLANLMGIAQRHVLDKRREAQVAESYRKQLAIRTPGVQQKVVNLSGGNQQKVVLSKWLFTDPELLILDEPTRGIDVGAKFEIYTIMKDLADQGRGVLMISSEMPELLGMCDRIYVMNEGRIVGELSRGEAEPGKDHGADREGQRQDHREGGVMADNQSASGRAPARKRDAPGAGRHRGAVLGPGVDAGQADVPAGPEHHQHLPAERPRHHPGAGDAPDHRRRAHRPLRRLGRRLHRGRRRLSDRRPETARLAVVIPLTLIVGGLIGAAQGYWVAYWRIPSFIVTLAGMLVFRGATLWLLGGQNIGPFPKEFQAMSSGFIPDLTGLGKPHGLTLIIAALAIAVVIWIGIRARARDAEFGIAPEPAGLFWGRTAIIAAAMAFVGWQLASFRGCRTCWSCCGPDRPLRLLHRKHRPGPPHLCRRRQLQGREALGHPDRAAGLLLLREHGRPRRTGRHDGHRAPQLRHAQGRHRVRAGRHRRRLHRRSLDGGRLGQDHRRRDRRADHGRDEHGHVDPGVGIDYQQMIKGLVLLAAVIFDVYNKNK